MIEKKCLLMLLGNLFSSREIKETTKRIYALNISSDEKNYEIKSLEDSILYIISSENFKKGGLESNISILKDIKAIDIWGGQCISRPYSAKN